MAAPPVPGTAPVLHGVGVVLSPWQDDDLTGIVELADDEGRRWSRSLAGVRTVEDAREWLRTRRGPDRVDWALRDPASDALLGRTSLHDLGRHPASAEIGYGVHPAHRGRGVAAAAVRTATAWGFGELGLSRIELHHDTRNLASCAVAARTGYAHEGTERAALGYPDGSVADMHRHARLAGDPDAPAARAAAPLEVPVLRGEGVVLRPWRDDEGAVYARGMSDPLAARWAPGSPPTTPEEGRALLARLRRRALEGSTVAWAIETDGVLAGSIGVRSINLVDRWAATAYWVLPEARGRGIAPRALRLATAYAFEGLGLHRMRLQHAVGNTASCRVAEKAGYTLESVQRESCLLADGFVDEHEHVRLRTDQA
jgi:RimJ/RimL family protein N-acetyltransferase